MKSSARLYSKLQRFRRAQMGNYRKATYWRHPTLVGNEIDAGKIIEED